MDSQIPTVQKITNVYILLRYSTRLLYIYLDAALVLEGGGQVGGHLYPEDLHGSGLQPPLPHKVLGGEHRGGPAVRGRAALQLSQRRVDDRGRLDLRQAVLVLMTSSSQDL